jgi:hypothetical protein
MTSENLYWRLFLLETISTGDYFYWRLFLLETISIGDYFYWRLFLLETIFIGDYFYRRSFLSETISDERFFPIRLYAQALVKLHRGESGGGTVLHTTLRLKRAWHHHLAPNTVFA